VHGTGLYRGGALAAAGILRRVYGLDVSKAEALDPLVDDDYVTLTNRWGSALRSAAEDEEDEFDLAVAALETITPEDKEKKFSALKAALAALALLAIPSTTQALVAKLGPFIKDGKASTLSKYGLEIPAGPSAADKKTGAFLLSSQGAFTNQEYVRRAADLDKLLRSMWDKGIEQGLSVASIGVLLVRAAEIYESARNKGYWSVTANALANRARTSTQINAFSEAGITMVRFVAVIDGATCETCEFMNGRTAPVDALARTQHVTEDLTDPDEIRDAQPWLAHDKTGIYYKRGGERIDVVSDVTTEELVKDGLFSPPIHGRCRCGLEPVLSV
jgi:hypothetical protein